VLPSARIAGTAAQDNAIDRALLVAHDLGDAIAFQTKRVPPADEINQSEIEGIERDGHRTPSARSFPLWIGSLVGIWL